MLTKYQVYWLLVNSIIGYLCGEFDGAVLSAKVALLHLGSQQDLADIIISVIDIKLSGILRLQITSIKLILKVGYIAA